MQPQSSVRTAIADLPVIRAADLKGTAGGGSWSLDSLAGVLAEISEELPSGALSFAAELILQAQREREPVAWVAATDSVFFPPDFEQRGIDLASLAVVRAGGSNESLAAAEWLLRSAAFGLVVIDAAGQWNVNDAVLGRLQKLAERGQCAVVFLTRKPSRSPSLGSRISLHGWVSRCGSAPFAVEIRSVKDKRSVPGSRTRRRYHAPAGLR